MARVRWFQQEKWNTSCTTMGKEFQTMMEGTLNIFYRRKTKDIETLKADILQSHLLEKWEK